MIGCGMEIRGQCYCHNGMVEEQQRLGRNSSWDTTSDVQIECNGCRPITIWMMILRSLGVILSVPRHQTNTLLFELHQTYRIVATLKN